MGRWSGLRGYLGVRSMLGFCQGASPFIFSVFRDPIGDLVGRLPEADVKNRTWVEVMYMGGAPRSHG